MTTAPFAHPLYDQLVAEAAEPDLADWEYVQDVHQFRLYRRRYQGCNPYGAALDEIRHEATPDLSLGAHDKQLAAGLTGSDDPLYEYKVVGAYADVPAAVLDRVYTDWTFRQNWDVNMLSWGLVGPDLFQFTLKAPFPLPKREYLYCLHKHQITHDEQTHYVTLGAALTDAGNCSGVAHRLLVPDVKPPRPTPGHTRVSQFFQCLVITPSAADQGCQVYLHYFEHPQGPIPDFVVNWALKAALPAFVKNLHDACLRYKAH
ncbi:hypothetical protein H4R34_000201 [Dimargaris verticillata]|uniref:START domain-containing protein n=1 Tax=Dimargaris verticillata TaxID=2761393 RepID=A0A9W8BDT2_9FUNG|nr:hypothetical protein H4R34_000201 [Dimargaris verticillata]